MLTQKNNRGWVKKIMIGVLVSVSLLMIIPSLAMANDPPATPATSAPTTAAPSNDKEYMELMEKLGKTLILISEFLQRLIWPVLLLIGGLLKNDILFAAGMEETMLAIWRNIRNIVNILFILVLLGIAFYNVVGGSAQDYHIKTILPKFVIALIAVNFSFLAVKVVVDGVSVVTTAIFALPDAVYKEMQGSGQSGSKDLTADQQFIKGICEMNYGYGPNYKPPADGGYCIADPKKKELTQKGKEFFRMFDSNNAAIVLAVSMGKVAEINKVTIKDFSQAVKSMLLNVLFSTMMYIVYCVAFVAMLILLAIRLVVLWVTMVLSPLIVLKYVIPEGLKSSLGGADELGKKFVQNAIAPIPIALVMSIGFIMLQSWKQARFGSLDIQTLDVNLLTSGMSTLQDLMAAVAMVVVVWVGVFEAAKGTYAESIVGGLKTAVEGAGKFVAAAPFKYMPIIPVGAGGENKVSVATVTGALGQLPHMLDQKERLKQDQLLSGWGFAPDTMVSKEIKDTKNGTDMGAVLFNRRTQIGDRNIQKEIGEQIRANRTISNDMRRNLQGFTSMTDSNYNGEKILKDLQSGTYIPPAVMTEAIDHMRNRDININNRAQEMLTAGGATAPATGATAGAATAAGTAGAATATQQPPPASAVDQEVDRVFAGTDDAEKIAANNPDAIARRNKVRNELTKLKEKSEVALPSGQVAPTVELFRSDLDQALEQSIPNETARAERVEEIMKPYVEQMQRNVTPPATTGAPAGQPDPPATPPPDPPAGSPT